MSTVSSASPIHEPGFVYQAEFDDIFLQDECSLGCAQEIMIHHSREFKIEAASCGNVVSVDNAPLSTMRIMDSYLHEQSLSSDVLYLRKDLSSLSELQQDFNDLD
jgi:hypothetical protein